MCRFFETIRITDGVAVNLAMHEQRMFETRNVFFGITVPVQLSEILHVPPVYFEGRVRCRLEYGKSIGIPEFSSYSMRKIESVEIVDAGDVSYDYKFSDRRALLDLKSRSCADEIIVSKNGFLTDSSFSNIVFYDGDHWITPDSFLLNGTARRRLLEAGLIRERCIRPCDIRNFSQLSFLNAMLDPGELVISCDKVINCG